MSPAHRPTSLLLALCLASPAIAQPAGLDVQKVTDSVWAIVGPMGQRTPENLGNNATFGLVVTKDGAVLIDPGGSYAGAEALDAAIKTITDTPVAYVIDTGGQDHRWLGNGYWVEQGAEIIASDAAVADQSARASMQMTVLSTLLGDALAGTDPVTATITFEDSYSFELGGVTFDITHPGPAHTPGDSFVWVPSAETVFTGDIVYVERLLGVMDHSSISGWPESFKAVEALGPVHVVPGHGPATTLATARADTFDYLVNLRAEIGALIDDGGDILDAPNVDQSAFSHLAQFDMLAGRNAQQAYEQMEWE